MSAEGVGADEYRHQCLVRHVINMRLKDRNAAHRFLNGHTDALKKYHRGWNEMHNGSRLDKDVRDQWTLGNRAGAGEWK